MPKRTPILTILNRYITITYCRMLLLCSGAFVSVYLTIDFLEKVARFARNQASVHHIALFFLWKIPEVLYQITPLAVLLATLLTLGMLSRNSEIIALRSCGLSLPRITAPILFTALVVSLIALISAEYLTPRAHARMKYVEDILIAKKNPSTFFRQNNIWYRQQNTILQAKLFEPGSGSLKGITLWQTDADLKPIRRMEAARAVHRDNQWILYDVTVREFSGSSPATRTESSSPVQLDLKMDDLKVVEKYADTMGFQDLRRYCQKLEQAGYDTTRYRAQMQSRVSLPFASLIMAFLGIPFALKSGRSSGISVGIGITLGIGFSFFIVNAVLLSFGQEGVISPMVAAWAANALFTALAVWLTLTINR